MNIEVKNCNNIDLASFSIIENKLNIKLASNGTGKSTLAKALILNSLNDPSMEEQLLPFKLREDNPNNLKPKIIGMPDSHTIMCFNEDYVKRFNFQRDELLSNSFEILIKNDSYKTIEREIEELVAETKANFTENQEIEELISALKELSGAFKLTRAGISRASAGMKGLSNGNKINNIPEGLEPYQPFIQSEQSVGWIDWQVKGCDFIELASKCPFCTSNTNDKLERISRVSQEYDKNNIKNLISIINIIDKLGDYFTDNAKEKLAEITNLPEGIEREHESFIVGLKTQIDDFISKLEKIKSISGFQFNEEDSVSEKLPLYKLTLRFFPDLDSLKMQESIEPINSSIDEVISKAGILQGKINRQRREIRNLIDKHQTNINDFLIYAGYRYKVEIAGEGSKSQLKLLHIDHNEHLDGGDQYLSFGERNAFSIVLFMYECLAKNPDLIILDDPISSFDKNKKYAILEMLFRRNAEDCLKGKTVLMLTHDVEPIIDTVKTLAHKFNNQTTASFLKLTSSNITEFNIIKEHIKTFTEICNSALLSSKDEIIKLIYLRRFYEINDDKGDAYQVLSNLLHKREKAIDSREPKDQNNNYPELNSNKLVTGSNEIRNKLSGFSYPTILNRLLNEEELKTLFSSSTNGYEKLQLFRFFEIDDIHSVVQKFINETYHIENDFICQLDPSEFDMVPEYVIKECEKLLASNE